MLFDNDRKKITQFDISVLSLLMSGRRSMKSPILKKTYAPAGYDFVVRTCGYDAEQEEFLSDIFDIYYSGSEDRFWITTEQDPDISVDIQAIYFYIDWETDRIRTSIDRTKGNRIEQIEYYHYDLGRVGFNSTQAQQAFMDLYEVFEEFAEWYLPTSYRVGSDWVAFKNYRTSGTQPMTAWTNDDAYQVFYTSYISYFARSIGTRTISLSNVGTYYYELLDIMYLRDEEKHNDYDTQAESTWYAIDNIIQQYDPETKEKSKIKIEKINKLIEANKIKKNKLKEEKNKK